MYNSYKNKEDTYFLGSIVLVKEEEKALAEVIDGQQRLTTLTMLLAVMASFFSEKRKTEWNNYIVEPGIESQDIVAKPRLKLREKDNEFYKTYIQKLGFDELFCLGKDKLKTESQIHIKENALVLKSKLKERFNDDENEIFKFGKYLINNCFIVVVSTTNQNSAFRVFSVLNNRGLDLLPCDIFKAKIIGALVEEDNKKNYTNNWENAEIELGREKFNDLFGHIRMMKVKTKARRAIQEEFFETVLPELNQNIAENFIKKLLEYANAYQVLTSLVLFEENNESLNWLNKLDNKDWLPVAILFYNKFSFSSERVCEFISKLERLASYLYITSKDVNKRIERYGKLLEEIENATEQQNYCRSVELEKLERDELVDTLNSDIYLMPSKRRNYIMLRLDQFVSDKAASYNSSILTIEHVLPQTVENGSEWEKWWPNEEIRHKWLHKIGNLVPLARRINTSAQNYDFSIKKEKYFMGKNGVSSYALTTKVLNTLEWTPTIVEKRQEELINEFKKMWDLE